jgi:hypothetical protein
MGGALESANNKMLHAMTLTGGRTSPVVFPGPMSLYHFGSKYIAQRGEEYTTHGMGVLNPSIDSKQSQIRQRCAVPSQVPSSLVASSTFSSHTAYGAQDP